MKQIIDILMLGGNSLTDEDVLNEVDNLVESRDRYLSLEPISLIPSLDSPQGHELEELLAAKGKQAKYERKRMHSVTHTNAARANEEFVNEVKRAGKSHRKERKHTTEFSGIEKVLDSVEINHAKKTQERERVRSLGLTGMQLAIDENEVNEKMKAQQGKFKI